MIGLDGWDEYRRLLQDGHQIVAFNRTPKMQKLIREGAERAFSLRELVRKLPTLKVVRMMLPEAGTRMQKTIIEEMIT